MEGSKVRWRKTRNSEYLWDRIDTKKLSILLAIIALLSAILTISGCASSHSGYMKVTSPDGNVSISIPTDWNTNDRNMFPGSIIGVSDVSNNEYLIVTAEAKIRLGFNSTVNEYLSQIKTAFTRILPDGVWENSSSVTISGLKGLSTQITGTNESNNTSTTCFIYALAGNSYYYNIVGVTDNTLVGTNKATIQKIINSFKVPVTAIPGSWRLYSFPGSVILAFILLIIGIGFVFLGRMIKTSIRVPHPGKSFKIVMIVTWVILILGFLFLYFVSEKRTGRAVQNGPIFPITFTCAVVTFAYLVYISRRDGILNALGNAIAGAAAGPMIFEFPFDWIVIPQVNASLKYLIVFFTPLFVIALVTISLLLLSRRVSITRYSMYALGAMFIVFTVWALFGYSYPATPVPFLLNAISKVLGFISVAALFSTGFKKKTPAEIKKSTEGQQQSVVY